MKRLALVALAGASVLLWLLLRGDPTRAVEVEPMRPAPPPAAEQELAPAELPASPVFATSERQPIRIVEGEVDEPAFELTDAASPAPGSALRFCAVVRDALTGRPIARAKACASGSAGAGESEALSDAGGRFELFIPSSSGLGFGHVTAEGYGKGVFVFDHEHDTPALADVIELLGAAGLDVRVHDPEGRPLEGCEVTLTCPGEFVMRGNAGILRREGASWAELTDAGGMARFSDLNAETALAWRARGPAESGWREGRLAFAPGERKRLEVELGGAARVSGRARDEHGAPVGELPLFLAPASNETHHGDHQRMLRTTSDAAGAFEFLDVPFDSYRLGCEQNAQDIVAEAVALVVDRARVKHDLDVSHGLFLSGRAVGTAEELEELHSVAARRWDGEDRASSKFVDATFRIGPLAPGEYLVSASAGSTATAVVRAPAGTSDVELPVLHSREIPLRVEGAADGALDLTVFDLERETGMLWSERDARFSVELAPGRHALQVTSAGDRVGLLGELVVTADEPRGELVVRMEQGALCTFVHRAMSVTRTLRLSVGGEPYGFLELFGSGAELLPGASRTVLLPPGRLAVELLEGGRVAAREELVLRPGERRRIDLAPR